MEERKRKKWTHESAERELQQEEEHERQGRGAVRGREVGGSVGRAGIGGGDAEGEGKKEGRERGEGVDHPWTGDKRGVRAEGGSFEKDMCKVRTVHADPGRVDRSKEAREHLTSAALGASQPKSPALFNKQEKGKGRTIPRGRKTMAPSPPKAACATIRLRALAFLACRRASAVRAALEAELEG